MVTLNIYVIHYKKLTSRSNNIERLQNIAKQESMININIVMVDDHQPEDINVNNIKNLVKLEKLPETHNQFYQSFMKQLSIEILSNTFHHFKAIQHISKQQDNEFGLILEDDVVYSDKVFTQMVTLINHIKSIEWDFVFLGQPSDQSVQQTTNLNLNKMDNNNLVLHCCESYMLNTKTAKDILLNFFPIHFVYNIHLSYIIDKQKYNCYKVFPNICGDGSKMGDQTSSILINNVLIFNDLYKEIYIALENNTSFTEEEVLVFESKFNNNVRRENPDFCYLEALFYKKIGQFSKAKDLFDKALKTYEDNLVPMNNTSTFLKNYIELYKIVQNE
jgi:GR25 family glycosyltransferase involved in LPS biosynthesis